MNTLVQTYRRVELFFGNMKFAVVIILIFAIALGYGTFMESYHGAEYANRLIYKSVWFMGIQFCMFLSILFATLIRLPPRKQLYGFYTIHAGLITLFLGSYISYHSGVDGTITLAPNLPSRKIQVNEDEFRIQFPSDGKEVTVALPFRSGPVDLDLEYQGIRLKRFLPFADSVEQWLPMKIKDPGQSSGQYRIYNQNFGEKFTLSLHPDSDFNNTTQLGPLSVHYMPESLAECFGVETHSGLIVWSGETRNCLAPQERDLKKSKSINGKDLINVEFEGKRLSFMPALSPLPLDESRELNVNSPYRVFSKKLFESSPHLFLFGPKIAFFEKEKNKWVLENAPENKEVSLPWMGFKVVSLKYRDDSYPTMVPEYVKPVQDGSQIIKGDMKALEVEISGQNFWVTSKDPIAFNQNNQRITFHLEKKMITLPYEITLDRFKMDTDPGTSTPASFESFVTLFKGNEGSTKHHVYMNNPLKHQNFTFYQASYFQTQEGPFGSVLSVNFDPGRPWKYLGSFLLVAGSIWHFYLRRKRVQSKGATHE
jgi:hypothetical protein